MAEINGSPASLDQLQALALTNYGHFTSMRVDGRAVRGLSLHLERLARDCQEVFAVDLDLDTVRGFIRQAANGREGSFTIRVTIFDPDLGMANIGDEAKPQVMVTTRLTGALPPAPLTAKTFEFSRGFAAVKHIGLFHQLRLRREAKKAGADDAIFVERDGRLSEGATWNLGFVRQDGVVLWPDAPVLCGVTMQLLGGVGLAMETGPVALKGVRQMRSAFATNTSVGVRTISAIDDVAFATDDPVLDALQRAYADIPGEAL